MFVVVVFSQWLDGALESIEESRIPWCRAAYQQHNIVHSVDLPEQVHSAFRTLQELGATFSTTIDLCGRTVLSKQLIAPISLKSSSSALGEIFTRAIR